MNVTTRQSRLASHQLQAWCGKLNAPAASTPAIALQRSALACALRAMPLPYAYTFPLPPSKAVRSGQSFWTPPFSVGGHTFCLRVVPHDGVDNIYVQLEWMRKESALRAPYVQFTLSLQSLQNSADSTSRHCETGFSGGCLQRLFALYRDDSKAMYKTRNPAFVRGAQVQLVIVITSLSPMLPEMRGIGMEAEVALPVSKAAPRAGTSKAELKGHGAQQGLLEAGNGDCQIMLADGSKLLGHR